MELCSDMHSFTNKVIFIFLCVCFCLVCCLPQLMMTANSRVRSKIQPAFEQLLMPHVTKVDEAILPGLTSLNWTSLNIEKYLNRITAALGECSDCNHFTELVS